MRLNCQCTRYYVPSSLKKVAFSSDGFRKVVLSTTACRTHIAATQQDATKQKGTANGLERLLVSSNIGVHQNAVNEHRNKSRQR